MYTLPQGVPNCINLGWSYNTMLITHVIPQGQTVQTRRILTVFFVHRFLFQAYIVELRQIYKIKRKSW